SRSMSLSRWQPRQPSRQSKLQRSFRSYSRRCRTRSGLAWSARPGGNVTGLTNQISDTVGKKLEFLREVMPDLRRLAIVANVGNPASVLEMGAAEATARTLRLEVTTSEIRRAADIAPAFEALKGRADALYICPDPLMNTNRTRVNILAVGVRLP